MLTAGPFRYQTYADRYLEEAKKHAHVPVKQAVISASALSLLYPQDGIQGYPAAEFLNDLAGEAETDIRRCLDKGAEKVQIDFTEGRLSVKLDPGKGLMNKFIAPERPSDGAFFARGKTKDRNSAPARVAIRTQPIAPMSTTRICYQAWGDRRTGGVRA